MITDQYFDHIQMFKEECDSKKKQNNVLKCTDEKIL